MVPMCATCRWYDRIDDTHGRCADNVVIDTDDDTPRLVMVVTDATNRCSSWATTAPTRRQRLVATLHRITAPTG